MKWLLTCSKDAIEIDFETVIESETEPGFWECYDIASRNGCEFFSIEQY